VSPDDTPEHLYLLFAQLLVQLVNDATMIPEGVTKLIVTGFESGRGNDKVRQLSLDICKSTTVKLQRHVSLYFNDLMSVDSSGGSFDDDSDDEDEGTKVVSLAVNPRIIQAHKLLLEV
jgi:hypothetical protein